jgi:hypothetical protein
MNWAPEKFEARSTRSFPLPRSKEEIRLDTRTEQVVGRTTEHCVYTILSFRTIYVIYVFLPKNIKIITGLRMR